MRGKLARETAEAALLPSRHGPVARYSIAVALTVTALVLKLLFNCYIGGDYPFLLFFTAVMSSAWVGGLGPGLLSAGLSAVFCALLFLPHHPSVAQSIWDFAVPLAVFLFEAVVISMLSAFRWGALRDRTLRLGQERALRHSEARSAAILEAAIDCVISMDARGRVTEWNPAAERCFGYTREEALGKEMAALIIPPSLREAHRGGLARYLATGEGPVIGKRLELTGVRKDGSEFPVELAITRTAEAGPPEFTGHLRDITQRKQAEQERERLLESERHARSEAERASQMKDEFLATLSHELRTPLNAILGWAQILKRGRGGEQELTEALTIIERNARVQTQLIEDLLDMSRIISGRIRLDVQRVDLPPVIEAAIAAVRPAADAKGIRVQTVLDPLAGKVPGDPGRLQQIVWNLLSNAIKFSPKGSRIHVTLGRVNSHVEIVVSDNGEGIRPEFLPYVFDRFRQADASTTRQHGGLGLGLSIVRHLTELHGGRVRAHSAGKGQGAAFTVELPLASVHEALDEDEGFRHPRSPSASAYERECANLRGVKVLVVDDEPDARTLIKRVLEDCEAIVTTAESAREGLAAMEKEAPHVLVSDIGMPGQDGYDLVRQVRAMKLDHAAKVPAIALTALARSEDRTRAMMAGFDMHVSKPVEPAELVAVVARLAGRAG